MYIRVCVYVCVCVNIYTTCQNDLVTLKLFLFLIVNNETSKAPPWFYFYTKDKSSLTTLNGN